MSTALLSDSLLRVFVDFYSTSRISCVQRQEILNYSFLGKSLEIYKCGSSLVSFIRMIP